MPSSRSPSPFSCSTSGLPEGLADGELWDALRELWPQFFAYVLTFAVLGINWITHHR